VVVRRGLFVEDFGGRGELLVLVHGLGGTTNTWYPQSQVLKRDFHVIGFDLAGEGRSLHFDSISIQSHVDDLRQVVREAGGTRVHLAGHSMGTVICQHFAEQSSEQTASLALAGALQQPPDPARKALGERAAKARAEGMRNIADAIVAGGTSNDTRTNQPAAAAFVRESLMGQNPEGYARNCEALAQATAADLSRVACPVLLMTGDEDRTAPPDVARAIASNLSNSEVRIIEGCGHWTPVERPKQVSYAMTLFYSRIRRSMA